MTETLLTVQGLRTVFDVEEGRVRAVDGVSFTVGRGETLALLGESGCGKSMTALSLLQLVPKPAGHLVDGEIRLEGADLAHLPERDMRGVRGRRIATIFQEPQTSLNPVMTVGRQIEEALPAERRTRRAEARAQVIGLLRAVGIGDPEQRYHAYPHQLSGGMKQRAMIAMALAARPDLLIADEPTTALDVTIQAQILDLLDSLQQDTGMAILLITHNLGVVARLADRVAVMYAGEIVEIAPVQAFFGESRHPYSHKLFQSLPGRLKRGTALNVIPGSVPSLAQTFDGCRFADRCERAWERCQREIPAWTGDETAGVRCHLYAPGQAARPPVTAKLAAAASVAVMSEDKPRETLLTVEGMQVHFPIHRGVFKRVVGHVKAVDGISFAIPPGRTLALVGESGCGKTTAGLGILQLLRPTAGSVRYQGRELTRLPERALRPLRRHFQVIFQDPFASLNPRMLVGSILAEGMLAQGVGQTAAERAGRVAELLGQVGLPPAAAKRYPHEFSGGQRQRISIARALAVNPSLIVCDEPTSALDVSVQAQILNLLKQLQDELGLSYLFISHDLSVVEYLAHEIAVMYLGRIVETGSVKDLLDKAFHPYTQALLAAVPALTPARGPAAAPRPALKLPGDTPSPSRPPQGCHFHPRCPQAMPRCSVHYPGVTHLSETQQVRCFLYSD